jgi:hypothetical protein
MTPTGHLGTSAFEEASAFSVRRCKSSQADHRRLVPLTTISTCRLPHREQTSRSRQSRTLVPSPYRRACSAGSGSTWCWHSLHHTISRTPAAAPNVGGGPSSDLFGIASLPCEVPADDDLSRIIRLRVTRLDPHRAKLESKPHFTDPPKNRGS